MSPNHVPLLYPAGQLSEPVLSSCLPSKDGLTARSGASLSRRLNAHHLQGETLMQDNTCVTYSAVSPHAPGTPGGWARSPWVAQCSLAVPCSSAGISSTSHVRAVPRLDVPILPAVPSCHSPWPARVPPGAATPRKGTPRSLGQSKHCPTSLITSLDYKSLHQDWRLNPAARRCIPP